MATIVLHAGDVNQVASASSFEVNLGSPALTMLVFSGIAVPAIEIDDDDDIYRDEVIVNLGHNVSAVHAGVSQVGLASISNDESAFVFATDSGRLEMDSVTGELRLRVNTAIMGSDSSLNRFSYQVVAQVTKVLSRITGGISVPRAVADLSGRSISELNAMFRVTANRIEPDPPGAAPSFTGERLVPVAIGQVVDASCSDTECFAHYVIDGCPFNTPLRVVVELGGDLRGLSAVQVAGPRPVLLTNLVPAVNGVDFAVIASKVA